MTIVDLKSAPPSAPPGSTAVPAALYRFFDRSGQLLYVGIAKTPTVRWCNHESKKPWWGDVANITLEWHDTRGEAERAEKTAIRTESPLYNIVRYVGSKKAPMPGRGRGRPAIGGAVLVRLGDLLPQVDAWAAEHGVKRAEAIRQLISIGLCAS